MWNLFGLSQFQDEGFSLRLMIMSHVHCDNDFDLQLEVGGQNEVSMAYFSPR